MTVRDSFASYNRGSQGAVPPDQQVRPRVNRCAGTQGMQDWLAAQRQANTARIALMGRSHGGMTTVLSLNLPGYGAFGALYPARSGALQSRGPQHTYPGTDHNFDVPNLP